MAEQEQDSRPTLLKDRSFWGMTVTQFLGAFNDNYYKQLVLLMALPVGGAAAGGTDWQGWATLVFSLPFVLFSGFTGFLSDRFSKTLIIVSAKYAEIVIMILAALAFLYYDRLGMWGTWSVLFLMGVHSTFFGPGKYGILPELFRKDDLPRANGLILMSTFLAIIFGTVAAGGLFDALVTKDANGNQIFDSLWIGSLVGMGIAVLGTISAHLVRRSPPAQPQAQLTWEAVGVSRDIRDLLFRKDRPLFVALLVSCVFWMVSSIALPTVNRLGDDMLQLDKKQTSTLVGMIAIGIMVGAPLGSFLSRKFGSRLMVSTGLWGIVVTLALLGLSQNNVPLFGTVGTVILLIAVGVFAAVYSIPLQVFLQERPPMILKGRMIATMNQANFVGILLAGPLYSLFEAITRVAKLPVSSVFMMIAVVVLPLAIFYRLDPNAAKLED